MRKNLNRVALQWLMVAAVAGIEEEGRRNPSTKRCHFMLFLVNNQRVNVKEQNIKDQIDKKKK